MIWLRKVRRGIEEVTATVLAFRRLFMAIATALAAAALVVAAAQAVARTI